MSFFIMSTRFVEKIWTWWISKLLQEHQRDYLRLKKIIKFAKQELKNEAFLPKKFQIFFLHVTR